MKSATLANDESLGAIFSLPLDTSPLERILAESSNDPYSHKLLSAALSEENYPG